MVGLSSLQKEISNLKFLYYLYYVLKDNIMKLELEEWIESGYGYPEFDDEP
jgi:hypothetical protein